MSTMVRILLPLLLALPSLALAGYEVSSFKKDARLGTNYWNAASALDSKLDTAWQVDPESENAGAWLILDVPAGEIDKLGMVIGYAKNEDTFTDFARVKTAKVAVYNAGAGEGSLLGEHTVSFEDKIGWQVIDLPDTKVGGEVLGGRVKVTVVDTYPGKDFANLAISEVRVHMKEFPAESLRLARPPDSEADIHIGDRMVDGDAKTFWAATTDAAVFAVSAPGYGLASLGLTQGPKTHARPKTIELHANQAATTHTLEDKPGVMQWVLLPCLVGYTGGAWGQVEVRIVDSYPGEGMNGTALAEVKLTAGSIEEF
jgi:hypothetical protein